jgi:hypothetical protein
MLSRLRTTNPKVKPQIKSGTNPGGVGHLWVKQRFIDNIIPYEVNKRTDYSEDIPATYTSQFIPAKIWDNKILIDADAAYVERLKRLPEDERRALLEGDWEVFKGQYFKNWRPEKHIVESFPIPRDWKRFGAMDWGYAKPSCFLWFAVDPKGRVYVYREFYAVETNINSFAQQVLEMSVYQDDYSTAEKLDYVVADPSMWSVTQFEKGESIAMKLIENGLIVNKADNNRLSGWSAMRDYLYHDDDTDPDLVFFDTCKNCIRTIPALVYDQRKPEDLNTEGEDHAADACRYGIMSNPSAKTIKAKQTVVNSFDKHFKKRRYQRGRSQYVGA